MDDELAAFVRSRHLALLRRAVLLTGDHGSAEDLVQEALAKLWLAWSRHPVDNPDAYVRTAMVHASVSRWRRLRPWDTVTSDVGREPMSPDPAAAVDEHQWLWQGVTRLPPRQRAVVVLRYYEGLSEDEICQALHISPGTVRSQMTKARSNLRALIANQQEAPL